MKLVPKEPSALHRELLEMLTWKRPHDTSHEKRFVAERILNPLRRLGHTTTIMGPMNNIVVTIGKSETLFSCHTDTVHHKEGNQVVDYDANTGLAYKSDGECLGADDTTGIWLMMNMIKLKVPGTYVFHRGEERGGIGSRWMADNRKDFLRTHKRAVAFDRKGEKSVISSQRGRPCCSWMFASTLAEQLGKDWKPDATGVFTDTANYTELIPECTNLSVGYYDQHTAKESQDVNFAVELLMKLASLKWEELPTVRNPAEKPKVPSHTWNNTYTRNPANGNFDKDDDDYYGTPGYHYGAGQRMQTPVALFDVKDMTDEELNEVSFTNLKRACQLDPEWAADKISELLDEILVMRAEKDRAAVGNDDSDAITVADYEVLADRLEDVEGMLDKVLDRLAMAEKALSKFPDRNIEERVGVLERKLNIKIVGTGAPVTKTVN